MIYRILNDFNDNIAHHCNSIKLFRSKLHQVMMKLKLSLQSSFGVIDRKTCSQGVTLKGPPQFWLVLIFIEWKKLVILGGKGA